jgi:3'-phosphoadenosine 5'-phosphosulfate sulfotransferase (PAPS reductase)/FAD synthetase
MKTVAWFSGGASSALAIKAIIKEVDQIIYIHIDDQHPDTMRFIYDCEKWFGKPVEIMQSPYKCVEHACMGAAYINGVHGAACTRLLKRRVREEWEMNQTESIRYIWGMDTTEQNRCARLNESMPTFEHVFPLVDKGISKAGAHMILNANGIKRPAMYDLGYHNNNCVGCLKGGQAYWNKIRKDFPFVFESRAKLERVIGHSAIKGIFLDELNPLQGKHEPPIVADCGILCEMLIMEPGYEI